MKVTTVHKTRIAVGISVVVALTLGGWLLSATAGAAKTAAPRVAYATGAMSGSDRASKLTAHAKSATTVLEPGTILNDRFVKSFKLSNGALTLAPFRGVTPSLSAAEQTRLWATDGLSGTVEGIGFADVTLKRSMTHLLSGPAITALDKTPSLVGLTKSEEIMGCTAETTGEGTSVIPVSQGWYAVILPLAPNKSDVIFSAESNVCRQLTPNTVDARLPPVMESVPKFTPVVPV